MARKFRLAVLISLLMVAIIASQVLAAPSIRFTLNGAKERFNAGAVLMLYGRTEDSGMALPDADVFIKVVCGDNQIYWSQTRSDYNGYFGTNFNLPVNASGNMSVSITALDKIETKSYELGVAESGLVFNNIGFTDKIVNQRVPITANEILLAFDSNVNYFKNNSADADLKFMGRNERNADCVRVYEKDTGKLLNTSVALVSNDSEGEQEINFYKLDGTQGSDIRRRIIPVSLNEPLQYNTTYSVVISADMAANNSGTLGQNEVIEFTTEAASNQSETIPVNITSAGGTISQNGITIVIPPNAVSSGIKVTVDKLSDPSGLPLDNLSQLLSDVFEIVKDKLGDFSKPVTLTLTFDKSKVDTDKYDIHICFLDEKTGKWIPLDNIKLDLANGKISGETRHFTKFVVIAVKKTGAEEKPLPVPVEEQEVNLIDIQGHWAEQFIVELATSGAIGGYPDGTFKPDQGISRAEFATILVKAFHLPEVNGKVFADTTGHWAGKFIATAAANGLVSGYSDTNFGPDDPITREQMAVMIVKAAKLLETQQELTFADQAEISAWAKGFVATASNNKLISGYPDNTFRPQKGASRAEAVTVIVKAIKPAS